VIVYPLTVVSVSYHYKKPNKRVGLVKADMIIISSKCILFSTWHSWKIDHLVLNKNHWLSYPAKMLPHPLSYGTKIYIYLCNQCIYRH